MPRILWTPPPDIREHSRIGAWMRHLDRSFADYDEAWRWSIGDLEGFWRSIWTFFDVIAATQPERMLGDRSMPGAVWCPGATLNYAQNALARLPDGVAIASRSQTRGPVDVTGADLRDQVSRARAGLVRLGVRRGDRVAAYLPNISEAVVAFLATASLGAVWSSCPPEFGPKGVVDRFAQIEPTVLLFVDGYRHRGRWIDRRREVATIRAALPGLRASVGVPYPEIDQVMFSDAVSWEEFMADAGPLEFEPVPFAHPLYVLYSSGTTGLPKPIVHGHGGILLEHLKSIGLHHDIGPGDRFFWFSTTGWMMWNLLVSGLVAGASIVLLDGDPGWPDLDTIWALAEAERITHVGASAPFLLSCRKAGLDPQSGHDLSAIREVGSTGAPLPAEGFDWVYEHVGSSLRLASVSGGTDVCTAFVGGVPLLPVVAGEISCRYLGVAAAAYDASGTPVIGVEGNLVVTEPMPSMPVGLWGDTDGSRYRSAYFERFPGVWDHGDWITITDRGTCIITGRSDSTLNRGGVRLGTSEFYSVVEAFPEIADSLVVHLEDSAGGPGLLLLFVQMADGGALEDDLHAAIVTSLRTALSPRHVPDRIEAVPSIPRTLTGKKLEVPVKKILTGTPAAAAASRDALADPSSLEAFEQIAIGLGDDIHR